MITLEKLLLVNVMITQLVVSQFISILKKNYTLIAINLIKKQKLDADPKEIQQINLTGNLDGGAITQKPFIINKAKKHFQIFQKEQSKYSDFMTYYNTLIVKLPNSQLN